MRRLSRSLSVWAQPKTSARPQAPAKDATSAATRPAPSIATPSSTLAPTGPMNGSSAAESCPTVFSAAPRPLIPTVAAKASTIAIMIAWVSTAPTAVSRRSERIWVRVSRLSIMAPCW